MCNSNSAWNWWNFVHDIMHECDNPLFYLEIVLLTSFCKSTAIICQKTSCRVVAYRKQKTKEYIKFLAQKVVAVALEI